jgi:molybdopterin biosynthesis enzyme
VGDRDFTAAALRRGSEGVEVFHGIRMVPVRPAGLYLVNRKPVFLLPGHCVAAALSFFLVVKPALNVISGLEPEAGVPKVRARLSDDVANSRPLDALFLAKLSSSRGEYVASPLPWGSDRITTLGESNGFLQVGPRQTLKAGEEVNVRLLGAGEFSRINGGIRL